jgi:hypothetical protein
MEVEVCDGSLGLATLERASKVKEMRREDNLDILKGESGLDHRSGPYIRKNHVRDHSSTWFMVLNSSKTNRLFIYEFLRNFLVDPVDKICIEGLRLYFVPVYETISCILY